MMLQSLKTYMTRRVVDGVGYINNALGDIEFE